MAKHVQVDRRTLLVGGGAVALLAAAGVDMFGPGVESVSARATGAWGGYTNGNIPLSALTNMGPGLYLRPDAATSMVAMQSAYRSATGDTLSFNEGYRDYATQVMYWNRYKAGGNVAASPGTSNHGWAEAVDFNISDQRFNWLSANAASFGWDWETGAASGPEEWHWEYNGKYNGQTVTAGGADMKLVHDIQGGSIAVVARMKVVQNIQSTPNAFALMGPTATFRGLSTMDQANGLARAYGAWDDINGTQYSVLQTIMNSARARFPNGPTFWAIGTMDQVAILTRVFGAVDQVNGTEYARMASVTG